LGNRVCDENFWDAAHDEVVMKCCWSDPSGVYLDKRFGSNYSLLGLVIVRKPETKKSLSVWLLSLNFKVGLTKPNSFFLVAHEQS
jgi:hypothetical protein